MKRADLLRQLRDTGCEMVRHGGKHDWYRNPRTGVSQPFPVEINENLAKHILKKLGE